MAVLGYYICHLEGFDRGMGPSDPDGEDVVMVFLDMDAAKRWVFDNHAEMWAMIRPCTVMEGHNVPVVQDAVQVPTPCTCKRVSTPPTPPIFDHYFEFGFPKSVYGTPNDFPLGIQIGDTLQ